MTCENCEREGYTYNMKCEGCKTRMFQREWCKYLRKVYSEQYGKAYHWEGGKHCDCTTVCLRKSRIVQKQETAGVNERLPMRKLRNR